jgi:hypothetical protein
LQELSRGGLFLSPWTDYNSAVAPWLTVVIAFFKLIPGCGTRAEQLVA